MSQQTHLGMRGWRFQTECLFCGSEGDLGWLVDTGVLLVHASFFNGHDMQQCMDVTGTAVPTMTCSMVQSMMPPRVALLVDRHMFNQAVDICPWTRHFSDCLACLMDHLQEQRVIRLSACPTEAGPGIV